MDTMVEQRHVGVYTLRLVLEEHGTDNDDESAVRRMKTKQNETKQTALALSCSLGKHTLDEDKPDIRYHSAATSDPSLDLSSVPPVPWSW